MQGTKIVHAVCMTKWVSVNILREKSMLSILVTAQISQIDKLMFIAILRISVNHLIRLKLAYDLNSNIYSVKWSALLFFVCRFGPLTNYNKIKCYNSNMRHFLIENLFFIHRSIAAGTLLIFKNVYSSNFERHFCNLF